MGITGELTGIVIDMTLLVCSDSVAKFFDFDFFILYGRWGSFLLWKDNSEMPVSASYIQTYRSNHYKSSSNFLSKLF